VGRHPFITTLFHRFQDERNIYMVLELVQCGDLWSFIQGNGRLPNEAARFYAAQIVMAVQYLHGEHIMFRDLNPSNVMLDRGCYVKLIDFGLSKILNFDDPTARTWTLCGSPEYLAAEIITSKGHSREVDWWALGIVIYEMLAGYPPFYDRDAFKIYQLVLNETVTVEGMPKHFEMMAKDLIKKLLVKNVPHRIGSSKNGAEDIKKHKWFRGLNWAALYNKQLELSQVMQGCHYQPVVKSPTDISILEKKVLGQSKQQVDSEEENGPTLEEDKDKTIFGGWESLESVKQIQRNTNH